MNWLYTLLAILATAIQNRSKSVSPNEAPQSEPDDTFDLRAEQEQNAPEVRETEQVPVPDPVEPGAPDVQAPEESSATETPDAPNDYDIIVVPVPAPDMTADPVMPVDEHADYGSHDPMPEDEVSEEIPIVETPVTEPVIELEPLPEPEEVPVDEHADYGSHDPMPEDETSEGTPVETPTVETPVTEPVVELEPLPEPEEVPVDEHADYGSHDPMPEGETSEETPVETPTVETPVTEPVTELEPLPEPERASVDEHADYGSHDPMPEDEQADQSVGEMPDTTPDPVPDMGDMAPDSHGNHGDHRAPEASEFNMDGMPGKNPGMDHADHWDVEPVIAITPPGPDADAQTITTYVSAVRAQSEIHMHGDDMAKMNEHMAAMDLVPRDEATHIAVSDGDWFDTATWHNGQIPGDNAKVLIPEGIEVQYGTVSDTRLFTVRVDGELDFATDLDSRMVFDTMVVSPTGSLVIGSVVDPVGSDVSVELIVADNGPIDVNWDPMLLSRGIVSHGEASIHGAKKDAHDKVIEDPMAGDTSVRFVEVPEGWEVGDKIVIAGTRYEGYKWDTDAGSTIHHAPEDEIRIISAIKDDTVFFEDELVHNHDTPRADLKTSVANYTRNVSIETESADEVEVHERGHVMFMHSDNVDIRYAEFYELGRTDKSELSMQVDDFEAIASDSNVQGRYSLHLHRTGTNDMENPVQVVGNAVWGSPGWGYVHHDSNADLTGNASYNTFGAGYAAETGNETGSWTDNIAIYSKGVSWAEAKNTSKLTDDIFDTGRSGDGFWFQGRLVASSDNVAASVNHGFTYFHRNGDDRMLDVDAAHFEYSGALWDRGDVQANDPPILNFNNNEAFAANQGLEVVKEGSPQSHDVWTHIDGFVAWSVREGVFLEYTSNYLLSDIDIIGKEPEKHSIPNIGIDMGKGTSSIVVIDTKIDGFTKGISFDHRGKIPVEMTKYTVVDTDIINVDDPFPDYLPQYNKITSRSELESYSPDLELDPLYFRANEMELTGTKFDGLGKVSFDTIGANAGQTNFSIKNFDIVKILEEDGYWSTSSGYDYFLLDVYFSDRATGDVYYETHTVELDEFVTNGVGQWWSDYENVSHGGIQDIIISEDGTKMAGTVVLDEAFVAVPFVDAREELQQVSVWDALTHGQGIFDEQLYQTAPMDEEMVDDLF